MSRISIANDGYNRVGINLRANTMNSTESNTNELNVGTINATAMSGGNISGSLYNGVPFIGPQWFGENVSTSFRQLVMPSPAELTDNELSSYSPGFPMSVMGGTVTTDTIAENINFGVYLFKNNSGTASATGYYPWSSFRAYTAGSRTSYTSRVLFAPSGLVLEPTDLITFQAKSTDGSDPYPEITFVPFGKLYEF